MTPKTGRPRGRPKGATNKKPSTRVAKAKVVAAAIEAVIPEAFDGNAHAYLMAVYKNPAFETAVRMDAAKAALPYETARIAPVEPMKKAEDHAPLGERIKLALKRDAIAASAGKVVELKKPNGHANGHG